MFTNGIGSFSVDQFCESRHEGNKVVCSCNRLLLLNKAHVKCVLWCVWNGRCGVSSRVYSACCSKGIIFKF